MESSIPFRDDFSLGKSLDVTKHPFKAGPLLVPEDLKPCDFRVNLTTAQYSIATSISDVCTILKLPLAYVLKVEANLIRDNVVTSCIQDVEDPNTITTIFRVSFLQHKQYLPEDAILNLDSLRLSSVEPEVHDLETGASGYSMGDSSQVIPKAVWKDSFVDVSLKAETDCSVDLMSGALPDIVPEACQDVVEDVSQEPGKIDPETTTLQKKIDPETPTSQTSENNFTATHMVKALEIGNELVIICKISTPDREQYSSTIKKLVIETFRAYQGILEPANIDALEKFAKKMDDKMKKSHYSCMKLRIEYCSYLELQVCPANLVDMVHLMREFLKKCEGWTDIYKQSHPYFFNKKPMFWKKGTYLRKEKTFRDYLPGSSWEETVPQYFHMPRDSSDVDTEEGESIEVIASDSDSVNYLRAIVEPLDRNDLESSTFDVIQYEYPATHQNKFHRLHKFLLRSMGAIEKLNKFLTSGYFISDDYMAEKSSMLKTICNSQIKLADLIGALDMVKSPSDEELRDLANPDTYAVVSEFIERVSTKLPPGADLDLLIIGKTGHGKSSTGNSILGQSKFAASADGESVTQSCGVGWTRVDARTIKVVDTPGVCDTKEDSDDAAQSESSVAIRAISEAITQCPEGFHSLLLVIRFGMRTTLEERRAIGMLKCILGEDIIRSHCVCIITYGDNFQKEVKGKKTFDEWCRGQSGFLKEIFEECQYRCVLFDNTNEDVRVQKGQLIRLVAKVDSLKSHGTRYTNSLFEFASMERRKAIEAEKAPEVNEAVTRDIQLVLNHLDDMIQGTDKEKSLEAELENLRQTVDNLRSEVDSIEGGRMETLINTVFSLSQAVHSKMDKMALNSPPNSPPSSLPSSPPEEHSAGMGATAAGSSVDKVSPRGSPPPSDSTSPTLDDSFKRDLEPLREDLRKAQDNMSPAQQKVNEWVTEKVEEKVNEGPNCFPGDGWVLARDGSRRLMRDLNVGEEILARNAMGQLVYEEVYMFGHRDGEAVSNFLVIETEHHQICVTEDHLVYCIRDGLELCLPARVIREGDGMITVFEGGLVQEPVNQILQEERLGLFAPFTKSGSVVVSGAVMSCYVDVMPAKKAHALLAPIRQLYKLSPSALEWLNGSRRGNAVPTFAKLYLKWRKRHRDSSFQMKSHAY